MKTRYLANREWSKNFKFNNYWYQLKSLYDDSDINDVFDFDLALNDKVNDQESYDDTNMNDDHYITPKLHPKLHKRRRTESDNQNYSFALSNINDDHWTEPKLWKRIRKPSKY